MLLSAFQSVVSAFQGGSEPKFAAAGVALGAVLGLLPPGNLIALAVLLALFFLRANKSLALLCAVGFKAIAWGIDPWAHRLGLAVLLWHPLKPLWTWIYNRPVLPWTRFNNTVVMGNLVIGIALFFPLYCGFKALVGAYRARWKEKVDQWPVMRAVKALGWYQKYERWHERFR